MTLLPAIARELCVTARRKSAQRIRLWTTGAAILVVGGFLLVGPVFRGVGVGGILFQITTGHAFALSAVAGVFVTADCLSEEKRAGTLGLLFLTDLRPHEIVFGKLVARMVNPFLAWLGVLPVISLSLLLGGVTAGEFWRVVLALLNSLFVSLAIGVAVSSWSRDAQRAASATLGFMVLLCVALPMVWIALVRFAPASRQVLTNWISPFFTYRTAMDAVHSIEPHRFWTSLLSTHAFGWLWLIVATLAIRKTWHDAPVVARSESALRTPLRRARRQRADGNPVYWLMGASPGLEMLTWGIAVAWVAIALVALQLLPRGMW